MIINIKFYILLLFGGFMKKSSKIIIIFVLFFVIISAGIYFSRPFWTKPKIKSAKIPNQIQLSKIKSVTQINIKLKPDKTVEKEYKESYIEYTPTGNIFKNFNYNEKNEISYGFDCQYDSKDSLIQKTSYVNNEVSYQENYIYNDNGLLTKETTYSPKDNKSMIKKNDYNPEGKLIKTQFYEENDKLKVYANLEYDDKGNCTKESAFDVSRKKLFENSYKYDENSHKIEEIKRDLVKLKNEKTSYKYDSQGNQIEQLFYDIAGNVKSKSINCFQNNKIIKSVYMDADGNINTQYEYFYYPNGNLKEKTDSTNFFDSPQKYISKYNENGNIVESNYCSKMDKYEYNSITKYIYEYYK
jgi:hypothetical protein